MSYAPLLALAVAALLSWLLMPLGIRLAWAIGWLDRPQAHKLHTSATAVLGGAVVFVAAVIAWGVWLARMPHSPADWEAWYLLVGAASILVVGLWDDRFGMQPGVKMLGQAAAATMLIASGLIPDVGLPVGIEAALTLVAMVALMNAVNFLDNMNGMVAGLSAIALAGFAWTSMQRGANGVAAAQLALAGACLGFLPHNFQPARIFMGDSGSMLIGLMLAAATTSASGRIDVSQYGARDALALLSPLLVVAAVLFVPLLDLLMAVVRRMRAGRSPFAPDKMHLHHRMLKIGHSQRRAVLLIYLWAAVLAFGAVSLTLFDVYAVAWGTGLGLLVALLASAVPRLRSPR